MSPRPIFTTFLAARTRAHDPNVSPSEREARAVDDWRAARADYRAALHEWEFNRTIEGATTPRPLPWRPLAVGACIIVAGLLMLRALCGCAGADPGPGDCAEACHAREDEGTRALLDCVAGCSNDDDNGEEMAR